MPSKLEQLGIRDHEQLVRTDDSRLSDSRPPTDSSVTNSKLATEVEDRFSAVEIVGGQTITPAQPLNIGNKAAPTMELTAPLTVTSFTNLPAGGTTIIVTHNGHALNILGKTDWVAVESGAEYHVRILKSSDSIIRVSDINGGTSQTIVEIATAINTTSTEAEKISYDNLKDKPTISAGLTVEDVIENTRIVTLNATPFTLKNAPGAGIVDDPKEAWVYVEFNATAYDANTTLNLNSGSTIMGTCDVLGATASGWKKFTLNGNEPEDNSALTVSTATGEAANGNSHIGVVVGYVQRNKTLFTFPSYGSVPGQVTGATGTVNSATQVTLDWVVPVDDGGSAITGYRIWRSLNQAGFTVYVSDTGNTNVQYVDSTGIVSGDDVRYRVQAINVAGVGPVSADSVEVTTWAVPAAPTIVTTLVGNTVSIAITPGATGGTAISGYRIQSQLAGGGYNNVVASTLTNPYVTGSLTDGTWDFRVYAINTVGESAASNVDSETIAAALKVVRINFSKTNISIPSDWNGIFGNPSTVVFSNVQLDDINGVDSGWTLTDGGTWNPFGGNTSDDALGYAPGDNSGVFPDAILNSYWFSYVPTNIGNVTLNVDTGKTYTLKMIGSYEGAGASEACQYRINGGAWTVKSTYQNDSDPAIFTGVSPDGSGNILIETQPNSGNFTFLAGIEISEE